MTGRRKSRASLLPLLLLALVAVAGWYGWERVSQQKAGLAALEQWIAGLETRLQQREKLLAELRMLELSNPSGSRLFVGDTPALAAAELQGVASRIIENAGGEIGSAQVLPARQLPPFVEVGLRVELTCSMAGLRDILYAVESHEPVIVVERLDASADAADADEPDAQINVSLELRGFSIEKTADSSV